MNRTLHLLHSFYLNQYKTINPKNFKALKLEKFYKTLIQPIKDHQGLTLTTLVSLSRYIFIKDVKPSVSLDLLKVRFSAELIFKITKAVRSYYLEGKNNLKNLIKLYDKNHHETETNITFFIIRYFLLGVMQSRGKIFEDAFITGEGRCKDQNLKIVAFEFQDYLGNTNINVNNLKFKNLDLKYRWIFGEINIENVHKMMGDDKQEIGSYYFENGFYRFRKLV